MRYDANVSRLHMTNGFQLRTFEIEAAGLSNALQSNTFLTAHWAHVTAYISHQLKRAIATRFHVELVTMCKMEIALGRFKGSQSSSEDKETSLEMMIQSLITIN